MVLTRQQNKALEEGQIVEQMRNGSLHQQSSECATFKALNNPLLLDIILKYSAYNSNGKDLDENVVYSIRLVSKIWHQSMSRVLKTSNLTLKKLSSVTDTCFSGVRYLNTKVLSNFISVFSKVNRINDSFLPLRMQLEPHYFIKENYKVKRNLFENCVDIVSLLIVNFPPNGGSMPVIFGQIILPYLQSLVFLFCSPNTHEQYIQTNARIFGKNLNGWKFLQEVLKNSQKLKHFTLIQRGDIRHAVNAGSLSLPESITSLELNGRLTSMEMNLLTTNKLPNFETLTIRLDDCQNKDQMVYKVLDNFRTQLKTICLKMDRYSFTSDNSILLKFPLLENLNSLTLFGKDGHILPEMEKNWQTLIPKVTRLALLGLSESLILKWIQDSKFESVNKLKILLRKNSSSIFNLPSGQIMKQIQTSFPNLLKLTLHFDFSSMAGLKEVFQNCAHLKKLRLNCHGKSDSLTVFNLASTLLGITLEELITIRNEPEYNLELKTDNIPTIMNLTELNCLSLWTVKERDLNLCKELYDIISCKQFGLEKMKQLKKFKFFADLKLNNFEEFYPLGNCVLKKTFVK